MPEDFIKAMALGADGIALANSAIQAIGCVAARMCNTNNCPSGVATQRPELRKRLDVETGANRLANFFEVSTHLMQVMSRACGHSKLSEFSPNDLSTWKTDMSKLSGVRFGGLAE
jgi:glutamate synthase domain-containing protein 2